MMREKESDQAAGLNQAFTAMPNAWLETIRNAGHSIRIDQPEVFTRAFRTALVGTTGRDDKVGVNSPRG
jgi:pimeloyl-ACP methyl ester carboxylesterase